MTSEPATATSGHSDRVRAPTPALPGVGSRSSTFTRSRVSRLANRMFSGWELKKEVVRPLVVNLLTAAIIGAWVWLFSADIRKWFFPPPAAADWPIYCVLEPVVNASPDAQLEADLYVINLEARKHTARSLSALAEKTQTDPEMRPPVAITVQITSGTYRVLAIQPDIQFNEGKGELGISNDSPQRWTVRVDQIEKKAVLRARIKTDAQRPITSKTDLETIPLKLSYARTLP